jgi:hypothetical protein
VGAEHASGPGGGAEQRAAQPVEHADGGVGPRSVADWPRREGGEALAQTFSHGAIISRAASTVNDRKRTVTAVLPLNGRHSFPSSIVKNWHQILAG